MFSSLTSTARFIVFGLSFSIALGLSAPKTGLSREKPVRVIVPFAPGGGSDTLARYLVREINASSLDSAPWVVINVPGAGGTIGSRQAKNAHPNGHTLLFLHDGLLTAQLSGKATYGPESFAPVAMTGKVGMVICVAESSEMETLASLIEKARKQPDVVTFAANLGAPSFYLGQLLESRHEGCRFRYVQSGGGSRRFADLTGGHVEVSVFSVSEYTSYREGGIRALAFLGETRHPALPELPTAKESGVDLVYENLQGWWAPRNTPEAILEFQGEILERAFHSPSVQEALQHQSIDDVFLGAESFLEAIERKKETLGEVAQSSLTLRPPRLDIAFSCLAVLALIGIGFTGQSPGESSEVETSSFDLRRALFVLLLFASYVTALALTSGWFLWLSVAFLLLLLLRRPAFSRRSALLLIPSTLIPTLLFFFIEKLLGLPLP